MKELRIGTNRSNVQNCSNSQNQPYDYQFGIPNCNLGDMAFRSVAQSLSQDALREIRTTTIRHY
jgi:uncharacterized membrane protein